MARHIAAIIYGALKRGIEQGYTLKEHQEAICALYQPSFDEDDPFAIVKEIDYLVRFEKGLRDAQVSLELFEYFKQDQPLDPERENRLIQAFNRAYDAIFYCGFKNQVSFTYVRFEQLRNASLRTLSRVDGCQVVEVENGVHLCPEIIHSIEEGEMTPEDALRKVKQAQDQVLKGIESVLSASLCVDKGVLLFNPAFVRGGLPEVMRKAKIEMEHEFSMIELSLKEQYPSWFEDPVINDLAEQLRGAASIK